MTPRALCAWVASGLASCALAAGAASLLTLAFADRFEIGATLSGLNPSGGGPGVLLLAAAAVAGLLHRHTPPRWSFARGAVATIALAAAAGALYWGLCVALALHTRIDLEPLATGVGAAYAVPRLVRDALALQHESVADHNSTIDQREAGARSAGRSWTPTGEGA